MRRTDVDDEGAKKFYFLVQRRILECLYFSVLISGFLDFGLDLFLV